MNENLQHDQQGAEFRADPTGGLLGTAETPATNAPTPETSPDVVAGLDQAEAFTNDPANATEAAPAAPGTPEAAEQAANQRRFRRTRRALRVAGTLALIDVATAIIL